jgi:hypothetical protein
MAARSIKVGKCVNVAIIICLLFSAFSPVPVLANKVRLNNQDKVISDPFENNSVQNTHYYSNEEHSKVRNVDSQINLQTTPIPGKKVDSSLEFSIKSDLEIIEINKPITISVDKKYFE